MGEEVPTFEQLYARKMQEAVVFLTPFVPQASYLLTLPMEATLALLVERGEVYKQEIGEGTFAALDPLLGSFPQSAMIVEITQKMTPEQRDQAAAKLRFFYHLAVEYLK